MSSAPKRPTPQQERPLLTIPTDPPHSEGPSSGARPAGPATMDTMWGLWQGVLRHCLALFDPAREKLPTAADLNVARQFLKDNAIRADESHKRGTLKGLQALAALDLPFTNIKH